MGGQACYAQPNLEEAATEVPVRAYVQAPAAVADRAASAQAAADFEAMLTADGLIQGAPSRKSADAEEKHLPGVAESECEGEDFAVCDGSEDDDLMLMPATEGAGLNLDQRLGSSAGSYWDRPGRRSEVTSHEQ